MPVDASGERYNPDSHASICAFFGIPEDRANKFEFYPFTDSFTVDQINGKDNSVAAEKWVRKLDKRNYMLVFSGEETGEVNNSEYAIVSGNAKVTVNGGEGWFYDNATGTVNGGVANFWDNATGTINGGVAVFRDNSKQL